MARSTEKALADDRISAKEAISAAFKVVEDFFGGDSIDRVLLDGIEFLDGRDRWLVTIGFDTPKSKFAGSAISMLAHDRNSIREQRAIYLRASDGTFEKMEAV